MKKTLFIIAFIANMGISLANAQQMATRTEFNKMLSSYFMLKNSLATDGVNGAGAGARSLLRSLKTFPVQQLSEAQQKEWNIQTAELRKFAEPMLVDREIKTLRKSFEGVSYAMIKLVKELNLNNNKVFVQYCPMIKKSWLNETEDIQNPFFGSQMYDCGEITSTIFKK